MGGGGAIKRALASRRPLLCALAALLFAAAAVVWAATGGNRGDVVTFTATDELDVPVLKMNGALVQIATGETASTKLVVQDTDATPVANRQWQVKDGLFQAADTTGAEGRYIKNTSLEPVNTPAIADDAVTYPKIQNVSAASRLLCRGSAAGAGDVQECTLGTGLSLSGTTLNATASGIPLDLANNGTDDSAGLVRINTANDTHGIFSQSPANELLVDMGQNWPTADVALDVTCTGCLPLSTLDTDVATQAELNAWGLTEASGVNKTVTGATCGVSEFKIRNSASTGAGFGGWALCYDPSSQKAQMTADCEGGSCDLEFTGPTDQAVIIKSQGTGAINLNVPAADRVTYTQGAVSGFLNPLLYAEATLSSLSGASATATTLIPANSKVEYVRTKNLSTITGATGISVGVSGQTTLWASNASVANGAKTNYDSGGTATGPILYPSATSVIVTAVGPNFTGGSILVRVYYTQLPDL